MLTERIRWSVAFKMIVFMPMAISLFAAGVILRLVYEQDPDQGALNAAHRRSSHDAFVRPGVLSDARPLDATRSTGAPAAASSCRQPRAARAAPRCSA